MSNECEANIESEPLTVQDWGLKQEEIAAECGRRNRKRDGKKGSKKA